MDKKRLAIENLQSLYVFTTHEDGTLHAFAKATPPKGDIVTMQILGQSLKTLLSAEAYERFGNTEIPSNVTKLEFDAATAKELAEAGLKFPGSSELATSHVAQVKR
ncbi:MAG: hypothetical protein AABY33_08670 [Pseudomonadota bacterium]